MSLYGPARACVRSPVRRLRARAGGTILSRGWRLAPPPFSPRSAAGGRTPLRLFWQRSCVTPSVPPFLSSLRGASALRGRGRAVGAALQPGASPRSALAWSAGAARVRPCAPGRGLSLAGRASPFKPEEEGMVPSSAALRSSRRLEPAGSSLGEQPTVMAPAAAA